MFYKDIEHIGGNKLHGLVQGWYHSGKKAVKKNVQKMREATFPWAKNQIKLEIMEEWDAGSRRIKYKRQELRLHFSIDSADFKLKGRISPSSEQSRTNRPNR